MNTEKASSNPQLLYSEYIDTNAAKHVVQLIESKSKEKPVMKFTRSSVLPRILDLLPRLKESEVDLNTKDENERNIEVCDENSPVIEMNVAIPEGFKENESGDVLTADDENVLEKSDSEESSDTSSSDESEESSDEDTSSSDESEESDEENLHISNVCELDTQKSMDNSSILLSQFPISNNSSSKLTKTKLSSTSKSVNLVSIDLTSSEDSAHEPQTKRLCQLLD